MKSGQIDRPLVERLTRALEPRADDFEEFAAHVERWLEA